MTLPPRNSGGARLRTGELLIWGHAVEIQAARVLTNAPWPTTGPATQQADAYLYALALRNLIRAVDFVRNQTAGDQMKAIDTAIAAFDAQIPDAENVRHVLEHFDEYKVGKGDLQRKPPGRKGFPSVTWHERDGSTHVLWVAITGRQPYRLDIAAAQAAVHDLVGRIQVALSELA